MLADAAGAASFIHMVWPSSLGERCCQALRRAAMPWRNAGRAATAVWRRLAPGSPRATSRRYSRAYQACCASLCPHLLLKRSPSSSQRPLAGPAGQARHGVLHRLISHHSDALNKRCCVLARYVMQLCTRSLQRAQGFRPVYGGIVQTRYA